MFCFFKIYSIKMKTIRELNIKNWSGYFFTSMTNINDFDPEFLLVNDFKRSKDGSILFNMTDCEENDVPHIIFNKRECIFRKNCVFKRCLMIMLR